MKKYFEGLGFAIILILTIMFLVINEKIEFWEPEDQDDTNDEKPDMYLL